MRRSLAVVVVAVASLGACGDVVMEPPQLVAGDTVAADFAALADETFGVFVSAAPGVGDCVGTVRLEAALELPDAARYESATQTITVRVPATAPSLQDSLIHELAHHVEATCSSHRQLRPAFLEAQGLDRSTSWFDGSSWEETPSEQFAEAVVLFVLGQRRRNVGGVTLMPEARMVVAEWLTA